MLESKVGKACIFIFLLVSVVALAIPRTTLASPIVVETSILGDVLNNNLGDSSTLSEPSGADDSSPETPEEILAWYGSRIAEFEYRVDNVEEDLKLLEKQVNEVLENINKALNNLSDQKEHIEDILNNPSEGDNVESLEESLSEINFYIGELNATKARFTSLVDLDIPAMKRDFERAKMLVELAKGEFERIETEYFENNEFDVSLLDNIDLFLAGADALLEDVFDYTNKLQHDELIDAWNLLWAIKLDCLIA